MQPRTLLDRYRAAVQSGDYAFPLSELLGFHLVEVEPGRAVVEIEANERHTNPVGTLHGGVMATIADTAMGIAHGSLLDEGESATTIDLKINYLRPFWKGVLRATGVSIQHGRTLTYLECGITDAEGNLIARAASTCMTLRGDAARGR